MINIPFQLTVQWHFGEADKTIIKDFKPRFQFSRTDDASSSDEIMVSLREEVLD